MLRWPFLLVLFLGAPMAAAQNWTAYSSDNFTIYSDRKEEAVLLMLEHFEIFRNIALSMLEAPDQPRNERLKIFVFNRDVDYRRVQGRSGFTGLFYRGLNGPRMIVSPIGSLDVLFHEYVHYLIAQHSTANYPRWYNEGLASVLETTVIQKDLIRVGIPTSMYQWHTRPDARPALDSGFPAPVSEMVSLQPSITAEAFYATAWLMVHYLLVDSIGAEERVEQTADYLLRFDAGEDPLAAFETAFGISPQEMDARLKVYSDARAFTTIVFRSIEYRGDFSKSPLGEAESSYLLAELALDLGRPDSAERYLKRLDGLSARAMNAVALARLEDLEDGDELFEQLITTETADPEVAAHLLHYAVDRMAHARQHGEALGTSQLERAIQLGTAALRSNPEHPATLYYLGRAHELVGNLRFAAEALLLFASSSPNSVGANLVLAKIFVVGGNPEPASTFLARAYSATRSDGVRATIDEIRRRMDDADFVASTIDQLVSPYRESD